MKRVWLAARSALVALALGHAAQAATGNPSLLLYTANRGDGPEIYLDQAQGGSARQLTRSRGGNEQPRWSPDGSRIAFVSYRDGNGEIYVMRADGTGQERLTHDGGLDVDPRWSPDGRQIAFVSSRGGTPQVHVMNADGSGVRALANVAGVQGSPQWSPDGTRVAMLVSTGRKSDVVVVKADGSAPVNLTGRDKHSHSAVAWSPDGRRLAFTRYVGDTVSDVVVAGVDDGKFTNLTNTKSFMNTHPTWSPDGQRIAFLSTRDHPEGTRANLFVMSASGGDATSVAPQPQTEVLALAWSAAGDRIFFVTAPWGSTQIHSVRPDGSDRRQVSRQKGFDLDPQPCCLRLADSAFPSAAIAR